MASFGEGFLSRSTGVVFACTVGIALGLTSTVQTVFSLFLVPISNEFETSRSSVSAVLLLIALSNALVYPLIGRLADRFGARIIIMTGLLIFVLSVACASLVKSLIHLYVVYFMIGVSGSVLGPILFTKIIAGWFDNNRGFYLGVIGGVGNGIGSTLMPIFVFMLMSDHGWRFAYQGIALLILIIGFPVLYSLLRDPPDSIKALTDSKVSDAEDTTDRTGLTLSQSRQTKTFWLLLVSISLCTGCLMAVFTHIIPILTDRGLSMKDATSVLATFAMMTVVAQVSIGALLDKLTRPPSYCAFFHHCRFGHWDYRIFLQHTNAASIRCSNGFWFGCGIWLVTVQHLAILWAEGLRQYIRRDVQHRRLDDGLYPGANGCGF